MLGMQVPWPPVANNHHSDWGRPAEMHGVSYSRYGSLFVSISALCSAATASSRPAGPPHHPLAVVACLLLRPAAALPLQCSIDRPWKWNWLLRALLYTLLFLPASHDSGRLYLYSLFHSLAGGGVLLLYSSPRLIPCVIMDSSLCLRAAPIQDLTPTIFCYSIALHALALCLFFRCQMSSLSRAAHCKRLYS